MWKIERKIALFVGFCGILLWASLPGNAQEKDSLFAQPYEWGWGFPYKVKHGETLFILARRFHVPPVQLAEKNNRDFRAGLNPGEEIIVPLDGYNLVTEYQVGSPTMRVYYRVGNEQSLGAVKGIGKQTQANLQRWNRLETNEVFPNQLLWVALVRVDPEARPEYRSLRPKPIRVDSSPRHPLSDSLVGPAPGPGRGQTEVPERVYLPLEKQFREETVKETIMMDQRGMALFFDTEVKPSAAKTLFAFHNDVPKGRVIKVYNPGTGGTVFVKVLGRVPGIQRYDEAMIVISGAARGPLGVQGDKAWLELHYAPF